MKIATTEDLTHSLKPLTVHSAFPAHLVMAGVVDDEGRRLSLALAVPTDILTVPGRRVLVLAQNNLGDRNVAKDSKPCAAGSWVDDQITAMIRNGKLDLSVEPPLRVEVLEDADEARFSGVGDVSPLG